MKIVIQRVSEASVSVDDREVSRIGRGLLVLVGVEKGDGEEGAAALAKKIAEMRIFEDDAGKMNLSVQDVRGEVLLVSQFTLCADLRKGRRPSFEPAAPPAGAEQLCARFAQLLRSRDLPVKEGIFGAHMHVALINDGPVTFVMEY
ncbi:MAG: D-tyrosyl-tRNA(Tyr) deacylase [Planctomycetota bacterium]|nr:MAG: D-tyrosyl-tRNA(Tyr) deacylase [Planctomycetota bacterium]